jgi:sortase A
MMQKRTTRQRLGRRSANMLLIAGGLTLAFPFWSAAYTHFEQRHLSADYQRASASFSSTARQQTSTLALLHTPAMRARRLAALFARGLKPGDPIGRLIIPHAGINRIVVQGSTGSSSLSPASDTAYLRGGPVHYGVTPLPGAGEPFAVAGHRTTYSAPFYSLNVLRRGDRIVLDTPYGRFVYSVARVTTVLPSDVAVLYDRGYALVLTTCTPPYSASHRLVVWASARGFTLKP